MNNDTIAHIIHDVRIAMTFQTAGHVFIGAAPEALAAGYSKGSQESSLFISLFLNDLPAAVVTNVDGIIV